MNDLAQLRQRLMSNRRVICTGNPDNPRTLASGIKALYPSATFIHRANGWDLTDRSAETQNKLKTLFSQHNTFINASYIGPYVQSFLLDVCSQSVKFCDVFNIGSTHEFDGLGKADYTESKLDLQHKSLKLNTYRFQTHHIILGKVGADGLDVSTICSMIPWLTSQTFKVPIICMDYPKQPW